MGKGSVFKLQDYCALKNETFYRMYQIVNAHLKLLGVHESYKVEVRKYYYSQRFYLYYLLV